MVNMYQEGYSFRQIASCYDVHHSGVCKVISKYLEKGSVARVVGSGRKRITTDRDDRLIMREVKKDRKINCYQIRKNLGLQNVSVRTIRRRVTETGEFKSYWAARKPFISEKNRKKRVEWASARLNWTIEQWRKVVWSDESPFVLRHGKRFRVWRLHNERYNPMCTKATVKHDKKINVWGCFSAHGVGRLYRIIGIMDQSVYHYVLQWQMKPSINILFPDKNCYFQQDNDPKHTAKSIKTYLGNYDVPILDWPSQSPDLNPIENLWSILDDRVKDRQPGNEAELFQVLENAWKTLPVDLLSRLVDSMPHRCQAVVDAKGYATKY